MNIIDLWERVFFYLGKLSVFGLVRKLKVHEKCRMTMHDFVEWWVFGHFLLSLILPALLYFLDLDRWIEVAIALYGFLRVFEVIIYQINVLLFDPYRSEKAGKVYRVKSIRRIVVLLLQNYIEMMFWFSTMVIAALSNPTQIPYIELIQRNILCIITLDPGMISGLMGNQPLLFQIAFTEVIAGLIMTLISLARFIGILPPVEEMNG